MSSHDKKDDDFTPFKSFVFSNNEISSLEVEFETDEHIFLYKLSLTEQFIVTESMEFKELKKGSRYTILFEREKNDIKLNIKLFPGVTKKNLSSIPDHVSVIAFINANYNIEIISEVHLYFSLLFCTINKSISTASDLYINYPDVKERMEGIIDEFGIGIDKFIFEKDDDGLYVITANHKVEKKNYRLPLHYESRGTQALFCEIGRILLFLNIGSILVSDEIETGLHPEAVNKLINFVTEELVNKKKQFIFSSHSLDFMKKFDAQQIFLVEKEENVSELFRLDELRLRSEENYYKKYQSGAYGAFPKIRI
jgi:hypothetical protein